MKILIALEIEVTKPIILVTKNHYLISALMTTATLCRLLTFDSSALVSSINACQACKRPKRPICILGIHEIGFCICLLFDVLRLQTDDDDVTVPLLSASSGRQNEENNRTAESLWPEHRKEGVLPMRSDCYICTRSLHLQKVTCTQRLNKDYYQFLMKVQSGFQSMSVSLCWFADRVKQF